MSEIRILSLWQPWASLIALGLKQYETRSWATSYRGSIAIHAAKRPVCGESRAVLLRALRLSGKGDRDISYLDLPLGAIVAIADLIICLEMWDSQVYGPLMSPHRRGIDIASITPLERAVGDWREGRFAHKYENVRLLPQPVYCRGRQGLSVIREPAVLEAIAEVAA